MCVHDMVTGRSFMGPNLNRMGKHIPLFSHIHPRREIRNAMVWASYSSFLRNCKKLSKVRYSAAAFLILGVLIWSHRGVMFENVKLSAPAAPKRKFVGACGAKTHFVPALVAPKLQSSDSNKHKFSGASGARLPLRFEIEILEILTKNI